MMPKQKKKASSLKGISGLLESALGRHGITKQVTAALIVVKANEILAEMLTPPLSEDVKALVYKDGILTIACKNAAAGFDIANMGEAIGKQLETEFSDVTITRVEHRVKPEVWKDWD
jgi:hypothetical protein